MLQIFLSPPEEEDGGGGGGGVGEEEGRQQYPVQEVYQGTASATYVMLSHTWNEDSRVASKTLCEINKANVPHLTQASLSSLCYLILT